MVEPEEISIGTTPSAVPEPACGEYFGGDSWFSFEVPQSGEVAIQLYEGIITNAAFALYSGPCDDLEEGRCVSDYLCDQDPMPAYYFEDLVAGETYYLRIWNEDGLTGGAVDIMIANPSGNPYLTTGSATDISFEGNSNCIELTSEQTNQSGCAWYPVEIDFSEPFEQSFSLYFGDIQGQAGADGMHIIYTPENIPICGQTGGGMGYLNLDNTLGIEFDTYTNPPPYIDPPQDHTAISINGDMFNHLSGPVGLGAIADGNFHDIEVAWDPATQRFRVWFDGTLVHDLTYDIVNNVFDGEEMAFWGVSASTGGSINQHVLCFENLELENLTNSYTMDSITLCEGESIFLEGALQTEPGTYVDQYQAANGCDSFHTTVLDFYPLAPPTFIEEEICPGDLLIYEGEIYNQEGTYEVRLTDERGCDSTVFLEVSYFEWDADIFSSGSLSCDRDTTSLYVALFDGDPDRFQWSNNSTEDTIRVSEPGVYWVDVFYGDDCVWSASFDLEADTNVVESFDTLALCAGGTLYWMGDTIDQEGDYQRRTQGDPNPFCISEANLHVFESDYISIMDSVYLCPNDTVMWRGRAIDIPGQYDTIISVPNECDTQAFLEVIPQDFVRLRDTLSRCPDQDLTWRSQTIDSAGYYSEQITASTGCDTLAELWVNTAPFPQIADTLSICPGQDTSWRGFAINSIGRYTFRIPADTTCDTIAELWVNTTPFPEIRDTLSLCPNRDTSWRGFPIDSTGLFTFRIPAMQGCDTLAFISVGETPFQMKEDTLFRCIGDTVFAYGNSWDTAGLYQLQLPAAVGCDTVLELHIIDNPLNQIVDSVTLCPGEDILWRGERISAPGEYSRRLPAAAGCDTLAFLFVDVATNPIRELSLDRCPGAIIEIAGIEIDTGGMYEAVLPASEGCDTLLQIQVTDVPRIELNDSMDLCPGDTIFWQGLTIDTAGRFQVQIEGAEGCDTLAELIVRSRPFIRDTVSFEKCVEEKISINGLDIDTAGVYELRRSALQGCDTLRTIEVEDKPRPTIDRDVVICPDESFFFRGERLPADSSYQFILKSQNTCDTLLNIDLRREEMREVEIIQEGDLCDGFATLKLVGLNAQEISWGAWNPLENGRDSLRVVRAGTYSWFGQTPAECPLFDQISVSRCAPCKFFIPNVFSPNGDDVNDFFTFSSSCPTRSFRAQIFDRWGNMIVESRQQNLIWDGGDYGPGVYVYRIEVELVHPNRSGPEILFGTLTLVR
jgi:gliding motility-associated-like protein